MKKIVTHFITLLLSTISFGQGLPNQGLPNIIPPSPNAASLGQYADIPVSNYTGVPNISVPLYTATSGDIQLPITLNYHGSGIKVAQEASWVGLGWSLNAGGIITRQIKGNNDFEDGNGFIDAGPLPLSASEDSFEDIMNAYYRGATDSQPDIFYYNFLGNSGKFVFTKQFGNIVKPTILNQNNLDISYNRRLKVWTIVDGNGWIYTFNDREVSQNFSNNYKTSRNTERICCYRDSRSTYTSAWYLSKIETPTKDVITFLYDNERHATVSQVNHSESYVNLINDGGAQNHVWGTGFLAGSHAIFNLNGESFSSSQQIVDDVYLRKIKFNNGSIVFNSEVRTDLMTTEGRYGANPPQRLKSMEVFDLENNSIKKVVLNYEYTTRLKLNSIQEHFKNKDLNTYNAKPPYVFTYNDGNLLPKQTSYAIDHFGYYNGQDSNNMLAPFYDYIKPTGFGSDNFFDSFHFRGANRETHTNYMDAEILKKITYPTGGQVLFEFEPHTLPVDSTYKEQRVYSFASSDGYNDQNKKITFTLNHSTYIEMLAKFKNEDWTTDASDPCSGNDNSIMRAKVVLKKENGQVIRTLFTPYEAGTSYEAELFSCFLPPGTYSIEADNNNNECLEANVYFNYKKKILITEKQEGGLRIKSIKTLDQDGTFLKAKKYTYTDARGKSTGKLMVPIGLIGAGQTRGFASNTYIYIGVVLVRRSQSIIPLSTSASGNPIGYNQVNVAKINSLGSPLGVSEYYYINNEDITKEEEEGEDIIQKSLNTPKIVDPNNGKILEEKHFNTEGILVRKKKIKYKQEFDSATKVTAFHLGKISSKKLTLLTALLEERESIFNRGYKSLLYDHFSQWWHRESETETIYDLEGNNPLTKSIHYEYENASHKNITKTTQQSSQQKEIETIYKYPSDFPTGTATSTAVFNEMVSRNILNPVIKQQIKIAETPISTQINNYKNWGLNSDGSVNLLLPKKIQTSKGTNPLEDRVIYHSYDSKGNPKEVSKKDGTKIYYVWGYQQTQPIAKIEGYTSLSSKQLSSINQAISASNNDLNVSTENTLRSKLTLLRNWFPNAQVTTYTYDPLIGVTSITDPRGETVYYQYDSFNRLQYVKDKDGNILSENKYNYKQ